MIDPAAKIAMLERENDELRERVLQLEADLGMSAEIPPIFQLTGHESRVFGALLARDTCTKEQIMNAIYSLRPDGDAAEIKIVDVFVCKARKKLAVFGIEITTIWGRGYMLTAPMKARARAFINQSMMGEAA